jgi:hypothetical protein
MNWEVVSTVAEVLGATGVIITVIYLAVQIRQNTRFVQGATEHTLMTQEIDVYALLATHADVYQRGCGDLASLSKADRIVFDNLVFAEMSQIYSGWVQRKQGLIEPQVWQAYEKSVVLTLADAGFRKAWEEGKETYPKDFQNEVKALLVRGKTQ